MGNALTAESKTKLERLATIQQEVKGASREVRRRLTRQHVKQRILDTRMGLLMGNAVPHGVWVMEDKKRRLALDIARMREDTSMLNQSLSMIDAAEDAIGKLISTEHNKAMLTGVASGLQRIEHYEQRIADLAQATGGAQESSGELGVRVCVFVCVHVHVHMRACVRACLCMRYTDVVFAHRLYGSGRCDPKRRGGNRRRAVVHTPNITVERTASPQHRLQ